MPPATAAALCRTMRPTAAPASALLRRHPLLAIGLLIADSIAAGLALGSPMIPFAWYVAVSVALGFIVATRPWPARIAALVMTLGVLPGYALARIQFGTPYAQSPGWQLYAPTAVVAWLAGDSVRRAGEYAGRLRVHSAAEAVTAERLRISRELHDLVAHSIGLITLQAGAAARVIDAQPQRARAADKLRSRINGAVHVYDEGVPRLADNVPAGRHQHAGAINGDMLLRIAEQSEDLARWRGHRPLYFESFRREPIVTPGEPGLAPPGTGPKPGRY